jgi:AMP-binding enzyme C-terminal domain
VPGIAPDWFVRAVREHNRDELIVSVASPADPSTFDALAVAVEERLKERLGVRIQAEVVRPGDLDAWTEVNRSPKLKRFRDER